MPLQPITRDDVVAKAREYLGSPFQHQGRIKGRGIDCVGLPLCVAAELGLRDRRGDPFNPHCYINYPAQPTGDLLLRLLRLYLYERTGFAQNPLANIDMGDVLCLRLPVAPVHAAIVSSIGGRLGMIHVYNAGKGSCVVEHLIDEKWMRRIAAVFSFPGVA